MASIEKIRAFLVGKTILSVEEMDCDPGDDECYPEGYTGLQLTVAGKLGEDTVQVVFDFESNDLIVCSANDDTTTW